MIKEVNIEQLQKDAIEIFTHGFTCSESVVFAIRKHFEIDLSDDAIAMSSGFPRGIGGSGCICGALAGATMMIGYFFGRRTPGDSKINKCLELTKELHDYFKKTNGATCCRILIRNYQDKNSPERKSHCIEIVKNTVTKTAEIIMRELNK